MAIPAGIQRDAIPAERDRLAGEARQILDRADGTLSTDDQARYDELMTDLEALRDRDQQLARVERLAGGTLGGHEPGADRTDARDRGPQFMQRTDPWTPTGPESPTQVRSRALTAIERWDADDDLKQSATQTVARAGWSAAEGSEQDVAGVAGHVLRFSNPLYVAAFRKYAADPEGFVADLERDEKAAWTEAKAYARAALSTTGAVLPSPLDPTIVLTGDGAIDPMRRLARVDTTVSKEKRYITSAGSTFSYDAELAEVSDDTHTETEVTITTHKGQGFIQASLEVWADQPGFPTEVAKLIADGRATLDADKFVTGTGTDQPKGIETALAGTASEINSTGTEDLVADDVYALQEAVPPRFRQRGVWQLELSTLNKIRRMFNPSGTEPPLVEGDRMLGLPYELNSSVDPFSGVDPAVTASNMLLFLGDWRHYVILDRIGLSVHFVPPGVLQNTTTNLPDGRVGWYALWRTGADVLDIAPFRMLDVPTSAV